MKIAIMGAGAVGSYYGGLLARAGHQVVLIGRAAHADAVRRSGLRLQTTSFDQTLALAAGTEAQAVAGADWVLVRQGRRHRSRRCRDRAASARRRPGAEPAERHRQRRATAVAAAAQRVQPVLVYAAVEPRRPRHVRHHGRGELVIGSGPTATASHRLSGTQACRSRCWPISAPRNGPSAVNCAYNALSAISRLPYGRTIQGPESSR